MVDYERFLLFKEVRRSRKKKQRKKKLILVRRVALLEWGARNESKKKGLLVVYCYGYVVL